MDGVAIPIVFLCDDIDEEAKGVWDVDCDVDDGVCTFLDDETEAEAAEEAGSSKIISAAAYKERNGVSAASSSLISLPHTHMAHPGSMLADRWGGTDVKGV